MMEINWICRACHIVGTAKVEFPCPWLAMTNADEQHSILSPTCKHLHTPIFPVEENFMDEEKRKSERRDKQAHSREYYQGDYIMRLIEFYGLGFCLGNTLKYILRAGLKKTSNREDDLKDALWYARREKSHGIIPKSRDCRNRFYKSSDENFGTREIFKRYKLSPFLKDVVWILLTYDLNYSEHYHAMLNAIESELAMHGRGSVVTPLQQKISGKYNWECPVCHLFMEGTDGSIARLRGTIIRCECGHEYILHQDLIRDALRPDEPGTIEEFNKKTLPLFEGAQLHRWNCPSITCNKPFSSEQDVIKTLGSTMQCDDCKTHFVIQKAMLYLNREDIIKNAEK